MEKRKKCEDSVRFVNVYFCPSVVKKMVLLMDRGVGCPVVCCAYVMPCVGASVCWHALLYSSGFGSSGGRGVVRSPGVGFGVWGVGLLGFGVFLWLGFFFFGLQLLSGERCACCGFPTTISYKYLKNVLCNQWPFYSCSSFSGCDKNLLICFGFLSFVPISSESS